MGGGGGGGGDSGDGGFAAQQAAQESRKAAARAAVNRVFGVGDRIQTSTPIYGPEERVQTGGGVGEFDPPVFENQRPITGYETAVDDAAATNRAGREAGYGRVRSGVYDLRKQRLDTDRTDASRNLRFALLRSGNSGGGLDIDQNNLLTRKNDQGILDATNSADAAALAARSGDEKSRLDLLSRIDAGMDQGSATQGAQNQLQLSADNALASARGETIGNAFDNAGLLYQTAQQGAGYANGMNQYARQRSGRVNLPFGNGGGTVNQT